MSKINTDSIKSILPRLEGTDKIDALNKLALASFSRHPDSVISLAKKTISLSEKINYEKGIADGLFNMGNGYYILDSVKPAVINYLKALQVYENIPPCAEKGGVLYILSKLNYDAGRIEDSRIYRKREIEVYRQLGLHRNQIAAINSLGGKYWYYDWDSAYYFHNKALELLQIYPDTFEMAAAYFHLSMVAVMKHNEEIENKEHRRNFLLWSLKALELYELSDHDWVSSQYLLPGINFHIATAFGITGSEDSIKLAREYLNPIKAMSDTGNTMSPEFTLLVYYELARHKRWAGEWDSAFILYEKAISEAEKRLERLEIEKYLDKYPYFKITMMSEYRYRLAWVYYWVYRAYEGYGDFENALKYHKLYEAADKEIYRQENDKLIAMLEAESENEKIEKQIAMLERDKEINVLRARQSQYYMFGFAGVLVAVTLFGILFIRLRKIRIEQKTLMREKQFQHDLELKDLESSKLREVDKMKSRFFANISHEFRTPLTLILGPLDVLKKYINDPDGDYELSIIRRNALNLQNLINQLLNLSKLESGKMKLQAQEEDIVKLSRIYCQSFESLARKRNIALSFTSSSINIPAFVDQGKYEKILYNLLSNAFKFTDDRGEISISVELLDEVGKVKIKVSDTGKGIDSHKLANIFDRFYQVDDDINNHQQGTGIGLALARELVQLHHGEISVHSELGKGTIFTILFPLGKDHLEEKEFAETDVQKRINIDQLYLDEQEFLQDEIKQDPVNEIADASDGSDNEDQPPVILIVEDNKDMRYYIRSNMPAEFLVLEAPNGKLGLEKAIETIPDLIISDVMMPKMNGMELCRSLKADERTSHIPVILLTARAAMDDRLEGLETGADDFLTKPFDQQELNVRIKNLIHQRRKLQEIFIQNALNIGLSKVLNLPESGISSTEQSFLLKAMEIVNTHMADENFASEILYEELAMSYTQLYRKLKSLLGKSVTGFIRSVRLNRAAELIKANSGTITEIAFQVGFNNLSYFSKCFEQEFGVLPSQYPPN